MFIFGNIISLIDMKLTSFSTTTKKEIKKDMKLTQRGRSRGVHLI